jgi:hypothetical protein
VALVSTPSGRVMPLWALAPMRRVRTIGLIGLAVFLWGCPAVEGALVSPDVVVVGGASDPVAPGGQASVPILIVRENGLTGAVTVGSNGEFGPSIPSIVIAADQTTGLLLVNVPAATASGDYGLLLTVTASGIDTKLAGTATVHVLAPANFTLSVSQADLGQILIIPSTGTYGINILRSNFTQPVTLSILPTDFPSGVTATFSPAVVPGTSTQSSLLITVAPDAIISTDGLNPGGIFFTIHATSPGVAEQTQQTFITVVPQTFALQVPGAAVQLVQGGTALTTVYPQQVNTLNTPPVVTFAVTGPPGLTGTVSPAQLTVRGIGQQSTITVTAASSIAVGNYTMTVTGTAPTSSPVSATFAVQVSGPTYTLSAQTAPLNIVAGTSQPDNIIITRPAFNGAVTVTGTSDQGITVTPAAATTGISATVTVNVPLTATVGTHTVTLTGTAAGINNVAGSFAVVVSAPPANNTTWSFCPTSGLPLWVAVQDGSNAWAQVTSASNSYPFAISSAKGGIAYVLLNGGTTELHIFYGSQTELQTQGGALCAAGTGSAKSISGVAVNGGTAATARIALGSSGTSVSSFPGTFQFNNVPPGTLDLVAASLDGASPPNAIRMLLQRSLNIATGGTVGSLDFAGAGFLPTVSTLAVSAPGQTVIVTYNLHTANNPLSPYYSTIVTGTSIPLFGVPTAQQVAGDLHYILAQAFSGSTDVRFAGVAFGTIAPKTLAFGSALTPTPVPSSLASSPYARLRMMVTVQPEYNRFFDVGYQQSGTNHSVDIQITANYAGTVSSLNVDIPDFTAVTGWLNSWAPASGSATSWLVTVSSWSGTGGIVSVPLVEGATFTSASKQGSFTP